MSHKGMASVKLLVYFYGNKFSTVEQIVLLCWRLNAV